MSRTKRKVGTARCDKLGINQVRNFDTAATQRMECNNMTLVKSSNFAQTIHTGVADPVNLRT